jgi:hypothetical protein
MRRIIILTLSASLCLAGAAEAKSRKAHARHTHASGSAHVHAARTAERAPPVGHHGGKTPLDDSKTPSDGAWIADSSFGKAAHRTSGTAGFGLETSSGHKPHSDSGLGYPTKPRRHRAS